MPTIAQLAVNFTTNLAQITNDLSSVNGKYSAAFKSIEKSAEKTFKTVSKWTAAGTAAMTALTVREMHVIDANAKMADSFSVTYKSLVDNKRLADESGVAFEKLGASWGTMQKSLFAAAKGGKAQSDAFRALKLDVNELLMLGPDEQFQRIAAALSSIENPTIRNGLAMKIFKGDALALINVFNDYGAKLADVTAFNEKFGVSLSRIDAAKVEQANDALDRVGGTVTGVAGKIGVELAPIIEGLANYWIDSAEGADIWAERARTAIDSVAFSLDVLTNGVRAAGDAFSLGLTGLGGGLASGYALATGDKDLAKGILQEVENERKKTVDGLSGKDTKMLDWVRKSREESEKRATDFAAKMDKGNLARRSLEGLGAVTDELDEKLRKLGERTINGLVDDFTDLVFSADKGKDALRSFAASAVMDLGKGLMKASLTSLTDSIGASLFGSAKNGGGIGGLFSGISSLFSGFGGFKAEGGGLESGKWYIAGEHGPEPIWGGGPNAFAVGYGQSSSGGDTYNIDARGADQGAIARLEALIRQLNGTIERRAVAAVGVENRRNPSFLR